MEIQPIAHIENDFKGKFGIPRQSGLNSSLSKIVFEPPYRIPEAIRGLSEFSHIWLIWNFSETGQKWSPTVRPPVLGGNKRIGVFATRSPYRPNGLGLSCVKIVDIKEEKNFGTVIYVSGADLLDQTPIFDIKPYLPYTDCHTDANGGFTDSNKFKILNVVYKENVADGIDNKTVSEITEVLKQNPLPGYHNDSRRIYKMTYGKYTVSFNVKDDLLTVTDIKSDI